MNPADNLSLAQFLSKPPKGPPEEAALRGACGRAYYAAFATARDALIAVNFTFTNTGQDHKRVVDVLKASTDPDVATAASVLDQLRKTRNSSDYDVGLVPVRRGGFDSKRTGVTVALALGVIQDIKRVSSADPRLKIPTSVT